MQVRANSSSTVKKVKLVISPITSKGRRQVAGFYAHYSFLKADIMTVALISSPSLFYLQRPQKRAATHLLHLYTCSWLSRPVPVCAVARLRTRASHVNIPQRAKPAPNSATVTHHT